MYDPNKMLFRRPREIRHSGVQLTRVLTRGDVVECFAAPNGRKVAVLTTRNPDRAIEVASKLAKEHNLVFP